MNYIVLDLEWNQCPTGKAQEVPSLPFEIIEIGAVRLNAEHQIVDRFREIVKPQVYTSLHFRTREIVTLRSIDFAGARSFPEVAASFLKWCRGEEDALPDSNTSDTAISGEKNTAADTDCSASLESPEFCTWGPADLTELQRNLSYYNIEANFPFPLMYYDIQKIFSIVYEDRKSRKSLEYAVDFLKLPKDIAFHSALSDAIYASMVMQKLTDEQVRENSSVDYYRTPRTRSQEIHLHYSTYDKFVSRPFASANQAMKDAVVTSTRCPTCGKPAQKKIRWFSAGGHNQFALALCPEHGYLKGKIRLRQNRDGKTYVVKTLKPVSEEEAYQIYEKKEVIKVKRRLHRKFHKDEI
ncbi:MAG: exonuclease domain-containing protein [Clostridiales bacterium]|nr:exonuclease domain-containing protein [Clostridiales bacterium]